MGIPTSATMAEVFENHRCRGHRVEYLKAIEEVIAKSERKNRDDASLWKYSATVYKQRFVTRNTWSLLRIAQPVTTWYKGVWFRYDTPKYSFLTWLVIHNRLTSGDRMRSWATGHSVDNCLCRNAEETRNHLFFQCRFSGEVWKMNVLKLLGSGFTSDWSQILSTLTSIRPKYVKFLIRYTLQSSVYHIWRERNKRRHGEIAQTSMSLIKLIEKSVRNRINSIRAIGDHTYGEAMELWLSTR